MCAMSQQLLYGELFKDIEDGLSYIDDYAWGEELFEYPITIYTKNKNTITDYQTVCNEAVDVGLITINPHKAGMIEIVPALYEPTEKRVYIKDTVFDNYWKYLRKSIFIGIENNKEYCESRGIESPEDILDLNILKRNNKEPFIYHSKINYKNQLKVQQIPIEEAKRIRQSRLDNPKNIYFYSTRKSSSRQIHDKECEVLDTITDDEFMGSSEIPDGYILCKKCKRKLLIRMGCYPNTKQIPICRAFLQKYNISTPELERLIYKRITFHANDMSVMTIIGLEDTWQIRVSDEDISLWHNNYVKTSETERYITDGFHRQRFDGSMSNMLRYIEGYTWQKHLAGEERKRIKAEEEKRVAKALAERQSHWYYRFIDKVKSFLKNKKENKK